MTGDSPLLPEHKLHSWFCRQLQPNIFSGIVLKGPHFLGRRG